jgi:hypothetical protein
VLGIDEVLSTFYGEYDLNVDLSVSVGHDMFPLLLIFGERAMPTLRALVPLRRWFYKYSGPNGPRRVYQHEGIGSVRATRKRGWY